MSKEAQLSRHKALLEYRSHVLQKVEHSELLSKQASENYMEFMSSSSATFGSPEHKAYELELNLYRQKGERCVMDVAVAREELEELDRELQLIEYHLEGKDRIPIDATYREVLILRLERLLSECGESTSVSARLKQIEINISQKKKLKKTFQGTGRSHATRSALTIRSLNKELSTLDAEKDKLETGAVDISALEEKLRLHDSSLMEAQNEHEISLAIIARETARENRLTAEANGSLQSLIEGLSEE